MALEFFKPKKAPEKKLLKTEAGGRMQNIPGAKSKWFRTLLILGLAGGASGKALAESQPREKLSPDAQHLRLSQAEIDEMQRGRTTDWESPTVRGALTRPTPEGGVEFNPWGLIAPIQLELSRDVMTEREANVTIPYEYSRLFNSAKALNKDDHERVREYIDSKLRTEFAEQISALSFSRNLYESDTSSMPGRINVNDIRVTGLTSPEGRRDSGAETIAQGNVDEENVRLGQKRAETGLAITLEQLKKMGVDTTAIENAEDGIQSIEIQFSDDELRQMADLAQNYPGADDLEKIHAMIIDFNDGKIEDQSANEALNEILGSKRGVEIVIEYEGQQKKTIIIPIPLLLLFMAFPLLRRRRHPDDTDPTKDNIPTGEGSVPPGEPIVPIKPEDIPPEIDKTELPPEDSPDYEYLEEETIIKDLGKNFDNPELINRGLNYRQLAFEMTVRFDDFKDNNERLKHLTYLILEQWRENDIQCRKEAGVSEENLEEGLNYLEKPRQIQWAKMHAQAILDLAIEKRNAPDRKKDWDYEDFLDERRGMLLRRQTMREGTE